jgi:hypothetical protein
MFERLLMDPQALARQRNGPMAEEHRRYLAHCAEQHKSLEQRPTTGPKALRLLGKPDGEVVRGYYPGDYHPTRLGRGCEGVLSRRCSSCCQFPKCIRTWAIGQFHPDTS